MIRPRGWPPAMLGGVVGLAIAACFAKPDGPSGLAPNDDGGPIGDGQDLPLPTSCVQYNFGFAPAGSCGGWGLVEEGSGNISADQLHVTAPSSTSTASARCQSDSGAVRRATLDIVASVLAPRLGAARLSFYVSVEDVRYGGELSSAPQGSATMQVKCGATTGATIPWYTIQRYVRLTTPTAGRVVLEMSTNGATWDPVGQCSVPVGSARVGLELQRAGSGSAVTASFESLEICE